MPSARRKRQIGAPHPRDGALAPRGVRLQSTVRAGIPFDQVFCCQFSAANGIHRYRQRPFHNHRVGTGNHRRSRRNDGQLTGHSRPGTCRTRLRHPVSPRRRCACKHQTQHRNEQHLQSSTARQIAAVRRAACNRRGDSRTQATAAGPCRQTIHEFSLLGCAHRIHLSAGMAETAGRWRKTLNPTQNLKSLVPLISNLL